VTYFVFSYHLESNTNRLDFLKRAAQIMVLMHHAYHDF